jgi:hypothetical protein
VEKVTKIATGISLPAPIMQTIDAAKNRWHCDRGQAITRIVQEWDEWRQLISPQFEAPEKVEAQ